MLYRYHSVTGFFASIYAPFDQLSGPPPAGKALSPSPLPFEFHSKTRAPSFEMRNIFFLGKMKYAAGAQFERCGFHSHFAAPAGIFGREPEKLQKLPVSLAMHSLGTASLLIGILNLRIPGAVVVPDLAGSRA
ncbi:MAG: hypothetical protein WCA89_12750 [Terracidiphilus sp.]|jgi:hypothetical protein